MKNSSSTNYKKILIIILIFLSLILIISFSIYAVVKNMKDNALRNEVFNGLRNNDISFFADNKFYSSLVEKFEENNYNISSDINFSTTMENNMFSGLDLSKFKFNYKISRDNNNKISYNKLITKYGENHFLTIEAINEKDKIGIKSDEIVNRYVGLEKNNLKKISNKMLEKEIDFSDVENLKKYLADRENIDIDKIVDYAYWEPYIETIKSNINAQNIIKKENVVVTLERDQVNTTEYTISFSEEQVKAILRKFSSELEENDEVLSEFALSNTKNDSEKTIKTTNNKSNTSPIQIKAKGNNYNATINIWGENGEQIQNQPIGQNVIVSPENQISQNTSVDNASVLNQVESNPGGTENAISNNTLYENVTNTVTTNQDSNTVTNEITNNTPIEQINTENTQTTTEIPAEQTQEFENQEPAVEPENTILEEDNFRFQGFISINESTDYVGDNDFIIGENYEETLENISKLSKNLNWSSYILTGAKANCTKSEMKDYILNKMNELTKSSNTLIVKVYIAEGKAVKLVFDFPEMERSFDMEIASKGNREKYLNVKNLVGIDNDINGTSVSIYKKVSDNNNKLKLNVNKIQQNKINNKIVIGVDTTGNSNSQKYTNNIALLSSDSNGEFRINTINKIDFSKDLKIDQLDNENSLFIDELSDEKMLQIRDEIKDKISFVLRQKNQDLQIIDTANSNTIILSNDEE